MKTYKKTHECRGMAYEPPRSIEETLELIEKARKRLGRTLSRRTTAHRLVLDNLAIIGELRELGHRQEEAVLLILELSDDAHKPDTIRKAVRAVVGDWVKIPTGKTLESPEAECVNVGGEAKKASDGGAVTDKDAADGTAVTDENDGGLVL
tara:strand:+ start:17522 stop:17974 length:453 start_codon:yes stop_codon:yes gene_type:complete